MKVLIAVGGGGHFSPALAVIEQMPKDWDVLLVGRKYTFEGDQALSLEYQTALRLGLPFEPITTGRLQRKLTRHMVPSLIKIPLGLTQATKIVRRYKPDIVLSFGGYVSMPVVMGAVLQRIPIVIHEQTLHAGLANKAASRFATTICLSWQQSERFFPKKKTVLTGNPLRKEFVKDDVINRHSGEDEARLQNPKKRDSRQARMTENEFPLIYITGGSGGSHAINMLVEGCVEKLLEKYTVIHQTGDAKTFCDFERLEKIKLQLPEVLQNRYILNKFIDTEQVSQILSWADLIISRSGINTITELLYLGKPSLLIPLPYGQRNEQLANAEFVKKIGLAEVVDQLTMTSDLLLEKITDMVSRLDSYAAHTEAARRLIHTDAAEKIIKEVNYAKEKRAAA